MKRTLFTDQLEQLLLFGNVQLTPPAVFILLQKNIDTVFLRADGRYMGRFASQEQANVFLRKKQFDLLDDEPFCVNVARSIVQGKLMNQATLMARISRSNEKPDAGRASRSLRELAHQTEYMTTVDAIRGIEGMAASTYFKHFNLAFKEDWGFTKRVRRPPTDPVNAVLSLLYTFLINRCYAAVRIAGLDPYPAVLHTPSYGRHSLPLDLVEEFRAIIADPLTISLFNMHILKREDFESPPLETPEETTDSKETPSVDAAVKDPFGAIFRDAARQKDRDQKRNQTDAAVKDPFGAIFRDAARQKDRDQNGNQINAAVNDPLGAMSQDTAIQDISDLSGNQTDSSVTENGPPGKPPLYLCKEAFRRVLAAFSKKMETEFFHPAAERSLTYDDAIIFQARQYRKVVEGQCEKYTPLLMR